MVFCSSKWTLSSGEPYFVDPGDFTYADFHTNVVNYFSITDHLIKPNVEGSFQTKSAQVLKVFCYLMQDFYCFKVHKLYLNFQQQIPTYVPSIRPLTLAYPLFSLMD